jgi:hypothetical protein
MKYFLLARTPLALQQAANPGRLTSRLCAYLSVVVSCLLLALAGAGCNSFTGADSSDFAAVTIQNHSREEITKATIEAFAAEGYTVKITNPEQMIFEKKASLGTSISREGPVGAAYGAQTIKRVRLSIIELPRKSFRLECKAFTVSGGSDPFFQDEVALAKFRKGPYQSLLKKVKEQLN